MSWCIDYEETWGFEFLLIALRTQSGKAIKKREVDHT
jgi:hypothetical protein